VQMVLTVSNTDDFDFFADLDNAALDTTGHNGAAARIENTSLRHQGTVHCALWQLG
jgi:hypothetical protein